MECCDMAFSSIAKNLNRYSIIQSINDFDIYTKQDISRNTKLSFPTTSKIVDELVAENVIHTLSGKRNDTGGRKAYEYQLDKEYAHSLCMIIEPNRIKTIITNMALEKKDAAEKVVDGDVTIQTILSFAQEHYVRNPKIRSFAVGVPGAVHKGKIFLIDGFKKLQNCELQNIIRQTFHIPAVVLNNMNALISGFGKKSFDNSVRENIACIHIGENGPGCSCLVNGAPVSGFCGFQGEIGFNLFDSTRTFREIALNDYQNVNMQDYIGRLAVQIITMINPHQIMIYLTRNMPETDIKEYCMQYLPREVIPQFAYLHTYEADYTAGLMAAGIELIFSTIYQIHDI